MDFDCLISSRGLIYEREQNAASLQVIQVIFPVLNFRLSHVHPANTGIHVYASLRLIHYW